MLTGTIVYLQYMMTYLQIVIFAFREEQNNCNLDIIYRNISLLTSRTFVDINYKKTSPLPKKTSDING